MERGGEKKGTEFDCGARPLLLIHVIKKKKPLKHLTEGKRGV